MAEVGDEQRGLDPTVNALQERVAALLGQEAALLPPSGAMCNLIALRLHLRGDGEEIYLHRWAHPIVSLPFAHGESLVGGGAELHQLVAGG